MRVCGKEMVPDFARIMLTTGVRDGFVTRPPEYFANMLDNLGEHARLYMAFHEGQPIAGTLAIHYGDKVWYLYGASSNEHRNLMPNYLLQWSMIQWAVETGCSVYDFRGVSGDISEDNPLYGLYKFKKASAEISRNLSASTTSCSSARRGSLPKKAACSIRISTRSSIC